MVKAKRIHAGRYEYKGYELLNCGYHHPDHCIWWQAINMETGCADYSCHTKRELIEEIDEYESRMKRKFLGLESEVFKYETFSNILYGKRNI